MTKFYLPSNTCRFEWEFFSDEGVTVVALNNTLNYFKAQPKMIDGQLMETFNERMVKDCRFLDGCVYLYAGKAPEYIMSELIEKFQRVKQELMLKKQWKPSGNFTLTDNKIII